MIYILITLAVFTGDFFIKEHMEHRLKEGAEEKILNGFIVLRKHHNKGAFLNAGEKYRSLVAAISIVLTLAAAVFFILSLGTRGNPRLKTGLSLLLGGAFSNTYDRMKRNYVVDYLSFHVKWKWFSNIIFNISDFGIIIGAMLAALGYGE